jgi:nucleoside phosphorylase
MEPRIGIITALEHEYIAIREMLDDREEHHVPGDGAGRRYILGEIKSASKGVHSIVLSLADVGNNIASRRATLMLEHFPTIQTVIMAGIACGIPNPTKPERHVRLGDIVISDKKGVLQYDLKKETTDAEEIRSAWIPPSSEFLEAVRLLKANTLVGNYPWEIHLKNGLKKLKWKRPSAASDILADTKQPSIILKHPQDKERRRGQPKIHLGPVAAANTLLKNPERRDLLSRKFGVIAVEMEGSGIADATWEHRRSYLIVRGICDYGDTNKGDIWQRYAALAAAAYIKALLEAVPGLENGNRTESGGRALENLTTRRT